MGPARDRTPASPHDARSVAVHGGAAPVGLELARWVDDFWAVDGHGGRQRVLPDGCIDFIFDLTSGEGVVVGPMSRAEVVEVPQGARLFGVRFAPGRGRAFVDANLHTLEDRTVSLDDLTVASPFRLAERVAEARDHAARRRVIGQFLLDPRARRRASDPRVDRAVRLFGEGDGTVRSIARAIDVSERTLERLFGDHVGVPPKLYARIMRMQATLRFAKHRRVSQAELAARIGYADEAHLVREFRGLTGLTAKALLVEEDVGFIQGPIAVSA